MIEKLKEWSGVVALIAIILFLAFGGKEATFGTVNTGCHSTTTCLTDLFVSGESLSGQLTIGYTGTLANGNVAETGTTLNRVDTGTCYLDPAGTTIAASTTISIDCQATAMVSTTVGAALPGVTTGDFVAGLMLSTTTSANGSNGGLSVLGASASSTPGFITVLLANYTGTTYTWPLVGSASGTASYLITH